MEKQGWPVADIEPWHRKALSQFEADNDQLNIAKARHNLASLLASDPQRLDEALDLAIQSLAIRETLDPGAAEIWTVYALLAAIAVKRGDTAAARCYRAAGRKAHIEAPIARETLRPHRALIGPVLAALRLPSKRPDLEQALARWAEAGWGSLVTSLRALVDGQRDEEALCDSLSDEAALIVAIVLRCLADPEAEQALFSDEA